MSSGGRSPRACRRIYSILALFPLLFQHENVFPVLLAVPKLEHWVLGQEKSKPMAIFNFQLLCSNRDQQLSIQDKKAIQ